MAIQQFLGKEYDAGPVIYGNGGGVSGPIAPVSSPIGTGPTTTGIVPIIPPPEVLLYPPAPPPVVPGMVNPGTNPGTPSSGNCSSCQHEYKPVPGTGAVPVLKVEAKEVQQDAPTQVALAGFGGIPWWLLLILAAGIGYGLKKGR